MTEITPLPPIRLTSSHHKTSNRIRIDTHTIWNCHLIYLLVFICLLQKTEATCYTSDKYSACQLCLNQDGTDVLSCLLNNDPNNSSCRSICCYYTYTVSVPASCNSSNNTSNSLSISTIIIIIVFSIPVVICIVLLIHSFIVGINRTPSQAARPRRQERNAQSAINLQNFNLDQSFPYYIDRQQACSICLEAQCHVMTLCGHPYHSPCLRAWIKKKESCPLCVSQQYNPLAIFCTICGKSIKVNVMYSRMPSSQRIDWEQTVTTKCSNCENAGDQQEIEISMGQQQIQRYQKTAVPKRQMMPAYSQQKIVTQSIKLSKFT